MSDTSPKDQDALLYGHVAATTGTRTLAPRELLWRVTKHVHTIGCELRFGCELFVTQNGELSFSRRCDDESIARSVAHTLKREHLTKGWTLVGADA